jgi:hypothetical protein
MSQSTSKARARQSASTPAGQVRPPSAHVDDQAAARIPPELKRLKQWVAWRWEPDDKGKWKKPPIHPRTGKPTGATDESAWLSLAEAREACHRLGGDGIGFALGPKGSNDYVGADLDHCIDAGGNIDPGAMRRVELLDSYTERTPSGTGLHVLLRGTKPGDKCKNARLGIELYEADRYFTVTGRHLDGTPTTIERRQQALESLYREAWPDAGQNGKADGHSPAGSAGSLTHDDEEVLGVAMKSDGFPALWGGEWQGAFPSQNEADLSLASRLAFYCGPGQQEQVKRLFLRSGLGQRKKAGRPDYLDRTVDRAYRGRVHYFEWDRYHRGNCVAPSDGNVSVGPPPPSTDGRQRPQFANAIPDKQGGEVKHIPILMPELIEDLKAVGKGWPKRIEERLFVESEDHRPIYLDSSTQFFGWLDGIAKVYWAKSPGMIGQERFYEYVRKFILERFEAIDPYPHYPPMEGVYYMHPAIRPRRTQTLLNAFIDFFKPETRIDRELIKAAILTLFWGGPPGTRPMFRIDGPEDDPPELGQRAIGKTKFVELLSELVGGLIDIDPDEDMASVRTRILSSEEGNKRVLRLDNVKALRLSWAAFEQFVTSRVISGHALFRGEGQRPNMFTVFITMNGGSFSKDLVTRVIPIRLARPIPDGKWEDNVRAFIRDNRWGLVAEILGALADEPGSITPKSRWDKWELDVLSKVAFYDQCQKVIADRVALLDDDDDQAIELEEFFREKVRGAGHNPESQIIKIPTRKVAEWYSEYDRKAHSPSIASRLLALLPLKCLRYKRTKKARSWLWIGPDSDPGIDPVDFEVTFGKCPSATPY